MHVIYEKTFLKDIQKNSAPEIKSKLLDLIEMLKSTEDILSLKSLKKMSGYKEYYRIRLGDYRVGLKITENKFTLIRFLHRKDIYKNFPN